MSSTTRSVAAHTVPAACIPSKLATPRANLRLQGNGEGSDRMTHDAEEDRPTAVEPTDRALEVTRLLELGMSNSAIANELGISLHAVSRHVRKILDAANRTNQPS